MNLCGMSSYKENIIIREFKTLWIDLPLMIMTHGSLKRMAFSDITTVDEKHMISAKNLNTNVESRIGEITDIEDGALKIEKVPDNQHRHQCAYRGR